MLRAANPQDVWDARQAAIDELVEQEKRRVQEKYSAIIVGLRNCSDNPDQRDIYFAELDQLLETTEILPTGYYQKRELISHCGNFLAYIEKTYQEPQKSKKLNLFSDPGSIHGKMAELFFEDFVKKLAWQASEISQYTRGLHGLEAMIDLYQKLKIIPPRYISGQVFFSIDKHICNFILHLEENEKLTELKNALNPETSIGKIMTTSDLDLLKELQLELDCLEGRSTEERPSLKKKLIGKAIVSGKTGFFSLNVKIPDQTQRSLPEQPKTVADSRSQHNSRSGIKLNVAYRMGN